MTTKIHSQTYRILYNNPTGTEQLTVACPFTPSKLSARCAIAPYFEADDDGKGQDAYTIRPLFGYDTTNGLNTGTTYAVSFVGLNANVIAVESNLTSENTLCVCSVNNTYNPEHFHLNKQKNLYQGSYNFQVRNVTTNDLMTKCILVLTISFYE